MVYGLASLEVGDIEEYKWTKGRPENLGDVCHQFIDEVVLPHADNIFTDSSQNEVFEKQMQQIIEFIEILGPAFLKNRLPRITELINAFLQDEAEEVYAIEKAFKEPEE